MQFNSKLAFLLLSSSTYYDWRDDVYLMLDENALTPTKDWLPNRPFVRAKKEVSPSDLLLQMMSNIGE